MDNDQEAVLAAVTKCMAAAPCRREKRQAWAFQGSPETQRERHVSVSVQRDLLEGIGATIKQADESQNLRSVNWRSRRRTRGADGTSPA